MRSRRLVPALLAAGLLVAALWPAVASRRAARRMRARVDAVAARAAFEGRLALDEALSLRVQRLGPWLASWETVGGCGAGGGASIGTGVKWIGHGTTGGLFQVYQQGNYTLFTNNREFRRENAGFQYTSATQITKELSDKWLVGASLPLIYKYYYDRLNATTDVSNGGLGDVSGLVSRRFGRINDTTVTAIVGFPTGTYRAAAPSTPNSYLAADKQLGFGRLTGTLMVDHTIDRNWGLIVLGAAGGYRGGRNSIANYRAPGGSVYGYMGYFLGPLVPVLGFTVTGYAKQDTSGDFGSTVNAPVATAAANASLEWSNDYLAVLIGAQFPYAIRGRNWGEGPWEPGADFGWQSWTLALGLSLSPF